MQLGEHIQGDAKLNSRVLVAKVTPGPYTK